MSKWLITIGLLFVLSRASLAQETWADKLGYASGKRVLILHSNQMGAAHEFSRQGRELLDRGLLQSVGITVPSSWFMEFALWCRQNPGHDVGITLALNSPSEAYRWRPLASAEATSLVDSDGYFPVSIRQVASRAKPDEVKRELRRQIEIARAAGIQPSHFCPQHGALLTRPELTRIYLELAVEYWIPAVMVELTPAEVARLESEGYPISPELLAIVESYPLPKVDRVEVIPEADTYEGKREALYDLVRRLPPGITQIAVRPADHTAGLEAISRRWQEFVWDAQLLTDPEVHTFLDGQDVELTSWKEMMRLYENENAPGPSTE